MSKLRTQKVLYASNKLLLVVWVVMATGVALAFADMSLQQVSLQQPMLNLVNSTNTLYVGITLLSIFLLAKPSGWHWLLQIVFLLSLLLVAAPSSVTMDGLFAAIKQQHSILHILYALTLVWQACNDVYRSKGSQ